MVLLMIWSHYSSIRYHVQNFMGAKNTWSALCHDCLKISSVAPLNKSVIKKTIYQYWIRTVMEKAADTCSYVPNDVNIQLLLYYNIPITAQIYCQLLLAL